MVDVTFLPNPARGSGRGLNASLSEEMSAEVATLPEFSALVQSLADFSCFLESTTMEIRLGIGCNSGQHRSRIVAVAVSEILESRGIEFNLSHREHTF